MPSKRKSISESKAKRAIFSIEGVRRKSIRRARSEFRALPNAKRQFFIDQSNAAVARVEKNRMKERRQYVESILGTAFQRSRGIKCSKEEVLAAERESIVINELEQYGIPMESLQADQRFRVAVNDAVTFGHTEFFVRLGAWMNKNWNQKLKRVMDAGKPATPTIAESIFQNAGRGKSSPDEQRTKYLFRLFLCYTWSQGGHLMSGDDLVYLFSRTQHIQFEVYWVSWRRDSLNLLLVGLSGFDYSVKAAWPSFSSSPPAGGEEIFCCSNSTGLR